MRIRTENGARKLLKIAGAFWEYSDGSSVHAQLTSGMHSDLYVNLSQLVRYPAFLADVAEFLLQKARVPTVACFVGIAEGSITFGHECGRQRSGTFTYASKHGEEARFDRFSLDPKIPAVIVEDVITTAGSIRKVIRAVRAQGATPHKEVLAVVNRSGATTFRDGYASFKIVAAIQAEGREYRPDRCPLCAKGSRALPPKKHWKEFQPF